MATLEKVNTSRNKTAAQKSPPWCAHGPHVSRTFISVQALTLRLPQVGDDSHCFPRDLLDFEIQRLPTPKVNPTGTKDGTLMNHEEKDAGNQWKPDTIRNRDRQTETVRSWFLSGALVVP